MKRILFLLSFVAIVLMPQMMKAQNVQIHYDMGSTIYKKGEAPATNPALLTTFEKFSADKWGSSFFFMDMTYRTTGMEQLYMEVFRNLRFWELPIDVHIEYNGGLTNGFSFNNTFLLGANYSLNASDYTCGFSVTPSLKYFAKAKNPYSAQLTTAWYAHLFKGMISFTGFADVWGDDLGGQNNLVFLSQPQLWLNLNKIKGVPKELNLSVGGEVELSYNFPFGHGKFYTIPRLGIKYTL